MKRKMSKSLLMTALITGLCIGGGQGASAAENLQEFTLDPMIVTATRTEKNLLKVPASATVITKEQIEERNPQTVKEALKGQAGLYVDTALYESGSIQMRGFDAKNILIMLDGQPMNNSWNGEVNWEVIPVEQIERIEIVRGAASSLYGGRAVGGVINIISKDIVDKKLAGTATLTYGSNDTWKKAVDVQGKINDKWSFAVGYEHKESDGTNGKRRAIKSTTDAATGGEVTVPQLSANNKKYPGRYVIGGYGDRATESENINLSVKYNFDEDRSLKYAFTRSEYKYSYNNPFSYVKDANGNTVFGSGVYKTQDGKNIALTPGLWLNSMGANETDIHTLNYSDKKNLWNVNFGIQDVKKAGYTSAPDTASSLDYDGEGTRSSYPSKNYNLDIQKTWENIGKHNITVGGNWKDETMEKTAYNLSHWKDSNSIKDGKLEARGSGRTLSLFVQDEYKFDDKFTMYLGGRYDEYKKYDGYSNNTELDAATFYEFSPKISFEYAPDNDSNLYVSYGHTFNPPTLYQVFRETDKVQANPSLEPETADTYEIGYKKKFDKTMVGAALFYSEIDNALKSDGVGTHYVIKSGKPTTDLKQMYVNADEGKKKGIEFEVKHEFNKNLNTYLNYTWQKGELTTAKGTEDSYDFPEHMLHFGLDYNEGKFNAILDGQYVSARQAEDVATGEFYSEEAFFVMNAYFNYKLTPQATLQFGIENIFDKEYYVSEVARERTYYAGLRYSF